MAERRPAAISARVVSERGTCRKWTQGCNMFVRIALVRAVSVCVGIAVKKELLYFESSPPWHWYALLLASLLACTLTFYLAYLLAFYLAFLWALYLAFLLAFYVAFYLVFLLVFCLTFFFSVLFGISSGIVSGCRGPAVRTELGRSQVEVQRISLMSQGPRLRSSGAGLDRKVPGWGPAVPTPIARR